MISKIRKSEFIRNKFTMLIPITTEIACFYRHALKFVISEYEQLSIVINYKNKYLSVIRRFLTSGTVKGW